MKRREKRKGQRRKEEKGIGSRKRAGKGKVEQGAIGELHSCRRLLAVRLLRLISKVVDIPRVMHCGISDRTGRGPSGDALKFMVLSLEDRMKTADAEAVLPSPRRRADLASVECVYFPCVHPIVSLSPFAADHLNSFESISALNSLLKDVNKLQPMSLFVSIQSII